MLLSAISQSQTQPLKLHTVRKSLRRRKSIVDLSLEERSIEARVDQEYVNVLSRVLEVTQMLLIIKQRTGCGGVIVLRAGDEQEFILNRIPERRNSLTQCAHSAGAEARIRQTVVMIAGADDVCQACDALNRVIESLAPRDFFGGKDRRSRAADDIRNAIVANDREGLILGRDHSPKRINLRPHSAFLHVA